MIEPLVSVCIPTFNGAEFIRQTLDSILCQTHKNLEIIIRDDCSTDDTAKILQSFVDNRIKIEIASENTGGTQNWNCVTSDIKGKYLKVVCQDDILDQNCIEKEVQTLETNPTASFCWSRRRIINQRGQTVLREIGEEPDSNLQYYPENIKGVVRSGLNHFGEPCCVMMRSEAFKNTSGFEGKYLIDFRMWLKLWEIGPAVSTCATLSAFRVSYKAWSFQLRGTHAREMAQLLNSTLKTTVGLSRVDVFIGVVRAAIREKIRVLFIVITNCK